MEITAKKELNSATYFMLPLLGLTKLSYGQANFVNTYITRDGGKVLVEVHDLDRVPEACRDRPTYLADFSNEARNFLLYQLAESDLDTYKKFIKGQFSKFDAGIKTKITEYARKAGLPVDTKNVSTGKYITHNYVLGLNKHPELRKFLSEKLGVTIAPEAELISIPGEEQFIEIA